MPGSSDAPPKPAPGPESGAQSPPRRAPTGITRLAPSPTGALHLGNLRTFVVNWALARQRGWRVVLRIEDLDTPRNKPGATDEALRVLRWAGLDWDEGPFVQSREPRPHREAMERLARSGLAYPCALTRGQIEAAASAPQEGAEGHEVVFPASLRPPLEPRAFDDPSTSWRFVVPERAVGFVDEFAGPQSRCPARTIGDFVVWTARGQASYQLAVVVDDARQGVTHIVRGDDLLDSAARQVLLIEALGLAPPPAYCHLPLVVGADGRRLAKRHGDTRLTRYMDMGVRAERVLGLLGAWCGVEAPRSGERGPRRERSITDLLAALALSSIPRGAIVFTAEDEQWLLGG
ncbi:MAG TPA: tRNA glutamyl-Q(34) synthetase GluQRS [Phycisphaerales bacterium]|nr:tRNA glutamyl-Q(34) synthetase GluQRS [Phycisphaerales bacterium]